MFKVKHKETGEVKPVYGLCGILFMFYEDGKWICAPMEEYEPVEE